MARVLINNELLHAVRRFAGRTVCERAFRNRVIEGRRVGTPSRETLVKAGRTARAGNLRCTLCCLRKLSGSNLFVCEDPRGESKDFDASDLDSTAPNSFHNYLSLTDSCIYKTELRSR